MALSPASPYSVWCGCSSKVTTVTMVLTEIHPFHSWQLLDYESCNSYTFSVEVSNPFVDPRYLKKGPFKDQATVRVMVLNADEPPQFSQTRYRLDVSENCPPVCSVGRVHAVDPDTGQSSNIRCPPRPPPPPHHHPHLLAHLYQLSLTLAPASLLCVAGTPSTPSRTPRLCSASPPTRDPSAR